MSARVFITRAMPEAEATAARLRAMGAAPVLAPLLSIAPRAFDADVSAARALLFSSSNGVRAFAAASASRAPIVLAVGDATARAAREAGFADVRSADGDVSALAALARETLAPGDGALIHISGAHAAGDLTGALAQAGFTAERRIAYEARAAEALPEAFSRAGDQPGDIVLFHSARAAETFVRLGAPRAAAMTGACLSPAVAEAAAGVRWARLIVAPFAREAALLEAALGG